MHTRIFAGLVCAGLSAVALTAQQATQPTPTFDLVILNARVFDGTGNPWFPADIGVRDGRIAAVGSLTKAAATRVIDATGKYVSPGFIDIHSHADDGAARRGAFVIRTRRSERRRTL